jgi:anaerobic magnesium-protoporphyrin IX monomethyl ester cyclase
MRTVFINVDVRPDSQRRLLPVGLGYVVTAVSNAGIPFDIIDMVIDHMSMEELELRLTRCEYDVYALGCIVTGYKYVRRIAAIIRRVNPQAVIIAGNSVATSIPELLLRHTDVDIAVLGEADRTIVELLAAIDRGDDPRTVPGIALMRDDALTFTPSRPVIANIDTVGFPAWELFDLAKYDQYAAISANVLSSGKVKAYPVNSARGCPFACTFCYHVFKGEKYRKCSEPAIMKEIERLHRRFGANFISFWDELTFANIAGVESFIRQLARLDFRVAWDGAIRANLFNRSHTGLLSELKAAGCDNMAFSLENGSAVILKAINKKIDVAQFIEQSNALWRTGIPPRTSVIFGYPQETRQTIRETIEICEQCNIFPSVGFLLPLPMTPIYEWARENGHIGDEVAYLERIGDRQDFHINLTSMSDSELVETVESELWRLAEKQGLKLDSVMKTVTYRKPEKMREMPAL